MELTYEKMVQFDLVEELEKSLFERSKATVVTNFFNTLFEIGSVDQFIKESPSFPGSTDKIIRSELVSAIGATLAIEGTTLKKEEIEESFRKANLKEKLRRQEQEAENSRRVYTFLQELVNDYEGKFEYSEQMIKQIHKYFTVGMNYISNTPGEYRGSFQVTFGTPRRESLCKTRAEIEPAIRNFVSWLNKTKTGLLSSNPIVKAIMSHYYLTEIHPFGDGNGRTARALEALVLYENGVNNYCFWSLANFWSTNKDKYIIHLGDIRSTSNPWDFLIWGMKGYLDELKRIKALVLEKVKQLMLIDYANYLLKNKKRQEVKINQRIVDILNLLIRFGRIPFDKLQSSPEVVALYRSVSATTKYRDFKKIAKLGLARFAKQNDVLYIEPNFQILERLRYQV
jgi:Fic family protein